MYKRYSGIKCLILSVVTCGIYGIIWWCGMTKQHNEMAESIGEKKIMGYIPAMLLGCLTCGIYTIIWEIKFWSQVAALNDAKKAGITPTNKFLMLLMSFIPVYNFIWVANAHNSLADAYEA